jgi:hypothetical protein
MFFSFVNLGFSSENVQSADGTNTGVESLNADKELLSADVVSSQVNSYSYHPVYLFISGTDQLNYVNPSFIKSSGCTVVIIAIGTSWTDSKINEF